MTRARAAALLATLALTPCALAERVRAELVDSRIPIADAYELLRPDRTPSPARGQACTACDVEVHVVIDNEFLLEQGAGASDFVEDIVAAADAIMSKPQAEGGLDLDVFVSGGTMFAGPQPWTHSTNPITLLTNFRAWVADALPTPDEGRDVVVLFSGANLDGASTGVAFPSSVCSPNAIAIVTNFTQDTDVLGLVLAHQLGHMFGAGHDGIDNDCAETGFVMSPFVDLFDPADAFSPCSIDEINAFIATDGACLAALPCNVADFAEPHGVLDFSDVVRFLVLFSEMHHTANLAPDFSVFDFADVVAFLNAFGAGCP